MAAFFTSASSNRLVNAAPPITGVPISLGVWFLPGSLGASGTVWSLSDTASTNNYFRLLQVVTNQFQIASQSAAAVGFINFGTLSDTSWHFAVVRFISAANRRASILKPGGSVDSTQETTAVTPASIDTMSLGSLESSAPSIFFGGSIGEFWYTGTDIQPDGGQIDDGLLRSLAYGGPFSVPHVAKDVLEYRSLRKYPTTDGDESGEVYFGGASQTWTNTNGVTTGQHPPLPYWYVKPNRVKTELVI